MLLVEDVYHFSDTSAMTIQSDGGVEYTTALLQRGKKKNKSVLHKTLSSLMARP